jgi:hypothetical protein
MPAESSVNRVTAVIDIACAVALCIIAVRLCQAATFESIVTGVIEFLIAIVIGVTAIVKLPFVDAYVHALGLYFGRGLVYLLFGTLGLGGSGTDIIRYVASAATIGVGFLWLAIGEEAGCSDRGSGGR